MKLFLRSVALAALLFKPIYAQAGGVYDYEETAGDNVSVGGVTVTEGMAPAGLNDAIRAQLADFKKFLKDLGCADTTTGSSNAYAVSLHSAPVAYADNLVFCATANHSATGAATMNVQSLGVKDVKKVVAGVATALAAGDYPIGHPGWFTYSSANSAILLLNPALSGTYQPLDPELLALAGVTSLADALPYFTGVGTAAVTQFTAAARTLLDDASIAAMKVTLGLTIGTDVQAFDSDLTTWAGITPGAGVGTALAVFSSANIAAAATDETGTGALVFGTAPQLSTIELGDAADTTVSRLSAGVPGVEGVPLVKSDAIDTDTTLAANSDTKLASQKAVKAYIDALAAGLSWTSPVAVATTGNITLSGEQTLDGVLTSASRVLVWKQTAATENGIYVSAAGAWTRATDADAGSEFVNIAMFASAGTLYGGGSFTCTNQSAPTLGVTNITFVQTAASATYSAGALLGLAGSVFSVTDAETLALGGLTSAADRLPYFTGSGTASLATFTSAGRAIVDDADASAQRTTLGLAIGTNVEAWDADLDTYAGATPATGIATWLATPTSANLIAALTNETGTGAAVFATSPTLVTPILGTPISGTLTNTTGLPIATGVSGLGSGVATLLGTPSTANFAAAITGETGTGAVMFGTAPTVSTFLHVTGAAAANRGVRFETGGVDRWALYANVTAEAGANAGSDFDIYRYDDTGVFLGTPLSISRAPGKTTASTLITTGDIELGATTDTTIHRPSAGDLTVEGNAIYRAGGTDVAVADGGTGSSTAANARTALGVAIGSNVQAWDADLDSVAALTTPATSISGSVQGPGSAADNGVPIFDGATGKLVADSGAVISDVGTIQLQGGIRFAQQAYTIATDAITLTAAGNIKVDTEAAAATDNLATITFTGGEGALIMVHTINNGRDVTLKDGTGNINAPADCVLGSINDRAMLMYDFTASAWQMIACSING